MPAHPTRLPSPRDLPVLIWNSTKAGFLRDAGAGRIDAAFLDRIEEAGGGVATGRERAAWERSLSQMYLVLMDPDLKENAGVAVGYQLPHSAPRIDFIISGRDASRYKNAVVVELRSWERAERTPTEAVVRTVVEGRERDVAHPSYQASSYAEVLKEFNPAIGDAEITLHPCVYLHDLDRSRILDHPHYRTWLERAPIFFRGEVAGLRAFIRRQVRYGDRGMLIRRMAQGTVRPPKLLVDSLPGLLKGESRFTLLDDQKVAFERALHLVRSQARASKRVLLVEGGPGTGKSVVAAQLAATLAKDGRGVRYATNNPVTREVYEAALSGGGAPANHLRLFAEPGAFSEAESGEWPVLIVDEAHRLTQKSGRYQARGEHQVKELIHAAGLTVFFLDEHQRVTMGDVGTRQEILRWARELGAEVTELELRSQFRCRGSDGYPAWLDGVLQIHGTGRATLPEPRFFYDFRVVDSPGELLRLIQSRNEVDGRSRMAAGYCWRWMSRNDPQAFDVVIPEAGFRMRWNLTSGGASWLADPGGIEEIGCIETCHGLELDHIGVIVGPDLVVRDGMVVTRPEARDRYDRTMRGYETLLRSDPDRARAGAGEIILNTYRTLMTRGRKGCYVYCTDAETREHFRSALAGSREAVEGRGTP